MKGVKLCYLQEWDYKLYVTETKIDYGKWRFQYIGTKGNVKDKKYHTVGQGSLYQWKHEGIQTADKLSPTHYSLEYNGIKTLLNSRVINPKQSKLI